MLLCPAAAGGIPAVRARCAFGLDLDLPIAPLFGEVLERRTDFPHGMACHFEKGIAIRMADEVDRAVADMFGIVAANRSHDHSRSVRQCDSMHWYHKVWGRICSHLFLTRRFEFVGKTNSLLVVRKDYAMAEMFCQTLNFSLFKMNNFFFNSVL